MTGFPLGPLAGEFYDQGRKLVLLRPFQFVDGAIDITVPQWATTDFNSSPRLVWSFFPPWAFPEAGAVHDHLFRTPPDGWSRQNCDWIHWRILRVLGCQWWKAEIIFQALSYGSASAWNHYRAKDRAA